MIMTTTGSPRYGSTLTGTWHCDCKDRSCITITIAVVLHTYNMYIVYLIDHQHIESAIILMLMMMFNIFIGIGINFFVVFFMRLPCICLHSHFFTLYLPSLPLFYLVSASVATCPNKDRTLPVSTAVNTLIMKCIKKKWNVNKVLEKWKMWKWPAEKPCWQVFQVRRQSCHHRWVPKRRSRCECAQGWMTKTLPQQHRRPENMFWVWNFFHKMCTNPHSNDKESFDLRIIIWQIRKAQQMWELSPKSENIAHPLTKTHYRI